MAGGAPVDHVVGRLQFADHDPRPGMIEVADTELVVRVLADHPVPELQRVSVVGVFGARLPERREDLLRREAVRKFLLVAIAESLRWNHVNDLHGFLNRV